MSKRVLIPPGKVSFKDLHLIGEEEPKAYYERKIREISNYSLGLNPCKPGYPLNMLTQKDNLIIDNKEYFVFLIYQPTMENIDNKPSGLVFDDDLSFLQVNELLLYCLEDELLYICDYIYHYDIWDYDKDKSLYYFRYDRDVMTQDFPRKPIEHFHVYYRHPHYTSQFMTLGEVLKFIADNWEDGKFHIKQLAR